MASVVDWFRDNVHLPLLKNGISISLRTVKVNNSLKKPGPVFLGSIFYKTPISFSIPFPLLHPVPSFFISYSTQPFSNLPYTTLLSHFLSLPRPIVLSSTHTNRCHTFLSQHLDGLGWLLLQLSSMLFWPGIITPSKLYFNNNNVTVIFAHFSPFLSFRFTFIWSVYLALLFNKSRTTFDLSLSRYPRLHIPPLYFLSSF